MKKFLSGFLFIFFLISLVGLVISPNFIFAQKELEVEYPEVEGFEPETTETLLPNYVKYIFNFAIWASGFIALGALIYGGFKYLTSAGSPERIKDAKDQISAAILGLLILFSSYLLLITINPQLVIFHLRPPTPIISYLRSGVLVCKKPAVEDPPLEVMGAWDFKKRVEDSNTSTEEKIEIKKQSDPIMANISKYCYYIEGGGDVQKDFNNKIKYVYFIPDRTPKDPREMKFYGAIIYEGKGSGGESAVLFQAPGTDRPYEYNYQDLEWKGIEVSSIRPFVFSDEEPENKAIAYEKIDYNWGVTSSVYKSQDIGLPKDKFLDVHGFTFTPQSVEIKGNYIVMLCATTIKECEIFLEPGDANLNNNRVAEWNILRRGLPRKESRVDSSITARAKLY